MASDQPEASGAGSPFLERHQGTLVLAGLTLYVILLLIGTIGNLFEIEAITNFWLYR